MKATATTCFAILTGSSSWPTSNSGWPACRQDVTTCLALPTPASRQRAGRPGEISTSGSQVAIAGNSVTMTMATSIIAKNGSEARAT